VRLLTLCGVECVVWNEWRNCQVARGTNDWMTHGNQQHISGGACLLTRYNDQQASSPSPTRRARRHEIPAHPHPPPDRDDPDRDDPAQHHDPTPAPSPEVPLSRRDSATSFADPQDATPHDVRPLAGPVQSPEVAASTPHRFTSPDVIRTNGVHRQRSDERLRPSTRKPPRPSTAGAATPTGRSLSPAPPPEVPLHQLSMPASSTSLEALRTPSTVRCSPLSKPSHLRRCPFPEVPQLDTLYFFS
jgi:hypothetical protein